MKNLMKNKKGFTLAEVLITSAIIGVIASITIPNLMSNADKSRYRTKAKSMYSTLARAVTRAKALNGNKYMGITRDDIISQFNIIKDCPMGNFQGCIANFGYYPYGGGELFSTGVWSSTARTVILTSGASVSLTSFTDDCSNTLWPSSTYYCGRMHFDVNGPAAPNQLGVDVYGTILTRDYGLIPYGAEDLDGTGDDTCDADWPQKSAGNAAGYGCMNKVLLNEDY